MVGEFLPAVWVFDPCSVEGADDQGVSESLEFSDFAGGGGEGGEFFVFENGDAAIGAADGGGAIEIGDGGDPRIGKAGGEAEAIDLVASYAEGASALGAEPEVIVDSADGGDDLAVELFGMELGEGFGLDDPAAHGAEVDGLFVGEEGGRPGAFGGFF